MEDMLPKTESLADILAELLREHKGQDVSVLDLRGINNWTDFFVIVTVSSTTHMNGLERHIKEFCREEKVEIFGSSRKQADDQWRLIDLGSTIIHLMTADTREFYDLERLWRTPAKPQTPIPAHSSMSSQSSSSSSSS
jgi:ribosome-associated protein